MSPKKIEEHKFQDGELVESWSKLKIFTALGFLLVLICVALYGFSWVSEKIAPQTSVLGTTDIREGKAPSVKLPDERDVSNILNEAKDSLSEITSENLISSQAAIQRIIQDLESLQGGSSSAASVICNLICK